MNNEKIIKLEGRNSDILESGEWSERYPSIELPLSVVKLLQLEQSDKGKLAIVRMHLDSTKRSIEGDLDAMEEDLARYKGMMIGYKVKYSEALDAHNSAVEKFWEKMEADLPSFNTKVSKLRDQLLPLKSIVEDLNKATSSLSTWNIKELVDTLTKLNNMGDKNKSMVEFLFKNYKGT